MRDKLYVNVKHASYYITFCDSLVFIKQCIKTHSSNKLIFLITNHDLYKIYEDLLIDLVPPSNILFIEEGEKSKSLETIKYLANELMHKKANRHSLLIAFGGGVIGDITGFLASIFMRGISYIQIPTSLLSMVDSSIGGKTGVNLSLGKNMLGTFYQPKLVIICTQFLSTLSNREFKCGLAEIIKTALIKNKNLLNYIGQQTEAIIKGDSRVIRKIIYASLKIKKWVVQKDEKEANLRAILNFGHTLAHALESVLDYNLIKHGEAVSIGVGFATFLSYDSGYISKTEWQDVMNLLVRFELPCSHKNISSINHLDIRHILQAMIYDKKNMDDNINQIPFVLLKKLGKSHLPKNLSVAYIETCLHAYLAS